MFTATSLLNASIVNTNLLKDDLMALLRDDNYSTCAVFSHLVAAPWRFDFSLKLFLHNQHGDCDHQSAWQQYRLF